MTSGNSIQVFMLLTCCSDSAQGPQVCECSNGLAFQGLGACLGGNGPLTSLIRTCYCAWDPCSSSDCLQISVRKWERKYCSKTQLIKGWLAKLCLVLKYAEMLAEKKIWGSNGLRGARDHSWGNHSTQAAGSPYYTLLLPDQTVQQKGWFFS